MSNKTIAVNIKAIKLVTKWQKWFIPSIILNALFSNLSPYITIYMSAEIVNELAGSRNSERLIGLVLFTIIADLTVVIISGLLRKLKDYEWQSFENGEKRMFMEYGFSLDYEHLENPEISQYRRKIDESKNINNFGIWSMIHTLQYATDTISNIILSLCFTSTIFTLIYKNAGSMSGMALYPVLIVLLIALSIFFSLRKAKILTQLGDDVSNNMLNVNRIGRGFQNYQMGKDIRIYTILK